MNPQSKGCERCGGRMERGVIPCTDPKHGDACTELHFGWRCTFCGVIEGEKKEEKTGKRNLLEKR